MGSWGGGGTENKATFPPTDIHPKWLASHSLSSVSDFRHFLGLDHFSAKQHVWICFWPIHAGSEQEGVSPPPTNPPETMPKARTGPLVCFASLTPCIVSLLVGHQLLSLQGKAGLQKDGVSCDHRLSSPETCHHKDEVERGSMRGRGGGGGGGGHFDASFFETKIVSEAIRLAVCLT